jgi:hypothetical protein
MHTLPQDARDAVRAGDILAVRAAETAALVWTLAAADAFTDPVDSLARWRERLQTTAAGLLPAPSASPGGELTRSVEVP